jgi:hypothetical protein
MCLVRVGRRVANFHSWRVFQAIYVLGSEKAIVVDVSAEGRPRAMMAGPVEAVTSPLSLRVYSSARVNVVHSGGRTSCRGSPPGGRGRW